VVHVRPVVPLAGCCFVLHGAVRHGTVRHGAGNGLRGRLTCHWWWCAVVMILQAAVKYSNPTQAVCCEGGLAAVQVAVCSAAWLMRG